MSMKVNPLDPSPASIPPNRDLSPTRIFTTLVILIFAAEMIAMLVIYRLKIENFVIESLVDGLIMTVLIFPVLYRLQLRPLIQQIKERTRAEGEVRSSERLLRRVLELMPVGVAITDTDGSVIHGNPAIQQIWGGSRMASEAAPAGYKGWWADSGRPPEPAEWPPSPGLDRYEQYKAWWVDSGKPIEPDEWAGVRAIRRGETVLDEEIEFEGLDGAHKNLLYSAVPILDEQEQLLGAILVSQDITRLRKQEQDLLRTNELLERVFFSIDTSIAYLDRDCNFVRVNDTYARGGGHPPEFYIGKNHFDLFPHPENEAIFRQVLATGEPYSVFEKPFEYAEHPEWGATYWDWSLQPVMGSKGQVDGAVLSLVDVTRRKLAELQLERQNQELRQLSRAEHRQRELAESVVQATIAVNTSLELDQVLCSVLEQIRKTIPFEGADILLVEGETWQVASSLGFERYPAGLPEVGTTYGFEGYPLLQQVCASLQILIFDAVHEQPGWRALPELAWVRSFAAVPLIVAGNVTGVIELYSELPAAFGQEVTGQLVAFAAPAALALHNARLYQAETRARQVAETLSAAAQALTRTLELEQVIQTLLDYIHSVIDCDTAGVTLLEGEGRWTQRAVRGYHAWAGRDDIPTLPLDGITDSVIQRIRMTRKGLTIPNMLSGAGEEASPGPAPVRSWAILPVIASDAVIGFVELGSTGEAAFPPEQTQWAEALVVQASVAIQNAWLFEQVRSSSERLQALARKLVELQESERYHIARELHDEAGQALSSMKMSLARLEQDPDCPPHMHQRLLDLKSVADNVLEALHRLAMDLRPVALDHLGLVAALAQFASHLSSERLAVQFKAVGFEGDRLPQDLETSLYRIVQEALTNVVRHAHASTVGILLERGGGQVKLFVEDDGIGFAADQAENGERLGLVGMRERAEMFGGSLTIESSPESGTSIIVEVPDAGSYPYHR